MPCSHLLCIPELTSMDYEIRRAGESDIPRLQTFEGGKLNPTGSLLLKEVVNNQECWLAVREEEIIAYLQLNYNFYGNGFIERLIIKEEEKRQGLGGKMVEHAESICTTEKLFTSTNQSNIPMQILLQARKFSVSGIIHNLDEEDPEIVYFKKLPSTSSGLKP